MSGSERKPSQGARPPFSLAEKVAAERPDEGRADTQAPGRLHAPHPPPPLRKGEGEISYRRALPADSAALAHFAAATFTETFAHLYARQDLEAYLAKSYGEAIQRAEIEDAEIGTWLAFEGETLIGYAQAGPMDMEVAHAPADRELYRLYVASRAKGAGVAQALMQLVLNWAREQQADALWLSVWENNARAQAFYRRYGFTHMGEHKFMVGNTADRDFIWRLAL